MWWNTVEPDIYHRWHDSTAHAHLMLDEHGYGHTLRKCNTLFYHGNNGYGNAHHCYVFTYIACRIRVSVSHYPTVFTIRNLQNIISCLYEGWNFNFGHAAVPFDTAHLQSSYFHRPSMYSPKLCRTRSQRWGSRMIPLAAPVLLMVRTERSTAEGLNPPCSCPIR